MVGESVSLGEKVTERHSKVILINSIGVDNQSSIIVSVGSDIPEPVHLQQIEMNRTAARHNIVKDGNFGKCCSKCFNAF